MSRVVCAGHVNWDVTLRVDRLPVPDDEATVGSRSGAGGGSAANVAAALAALEVDAAVLGSVGTDDEGRKARAELASTGVDCRYLVEATGDTTTKYLLVDPAGQIAVLGLPGVNEAFEATDLPDAALADAEHLHLTGQRPQTAIALADRARDLGVLVSVDPGRRVNDRDFAPVLSRADVVFLNDREAGTVDPDTLPDGAVVVNKHGPRGASVRGPDGRYVHEGYPVGVTDTTGAGDAFAAGFVAATLEGADVERALRVANACGALAAGTRGARVGFDREAVADLLA